MTIAPNLIDADEREVINERVSPTVTGLNKRVADARWQFVICCTDLGDP